MKHKIRWYQILLPVLTVLWIGFIYIHSLQRSEVSSDESVLVMNKLQLLLPRVTLLFVRKAAHFIEFFTLGALLYLDFLAFRKERILYPAAVGLVVAGGDELIQRFVPGRSGELLDVLLDFCGVLSACLICYALRRLYLKRKRGKDHG